MWSVLDKVYRFLFRHGLATLLVLAAAVITYGVFGPTRCNFGAERAKVSRTLADMRTVRSAFHQAAAGDVTSVTLPMDVFTDPPRPVSFLMSSGTLMLVSVGPDGYTRGDAIAYDATNGTTSYGDIISTVAVDMTYNPF